MTVSRPTGNSTPVAVAESPNLGWATRGEFVWRTLFLGMAALVLLMSCWMSSSGENQVLVPGFKFPLPTLCSTKVLFGIDCPGCGLTRAFISISHGQLARAWHFNRASFFVYAFVAAQIPWHITQMWRLKNQRAPMDWDGVFLVPIGLTAVLLVNWLLRLFGW